MVLPGIIGGLLGGSVAIRAGSAVPHMISAGGGSGVGAAAKHFLTSPIIQGGQFGIGYTSGAYGGYGISNTFDPLGIHKPKYKPVRSNLGMPYGSYGYGRRYSYGRRYRRGYRYGRRSRYGYRRRYRTRYSRYY